MHKIKGVHSVLITPFLQDSQLDEEGLKENICFQMQNRVDGIVVLGTTGEAPTLSDEEKDKIVKIAVETRNTRDANCLVTVGTGSYATKKAIENTKRAKDLGADAALIVTPYYNKPTQQGMYLHFKAIAEAVHIPIIVYNIQGRTGQNLNTEMLKALSELPNIIGVKEASGNVMQMMDVYHKIVEQRSDFCLLSGDDALTLPLMALGGHGILSVVSNLVPDLIKALTNACEKGDYDAARKLHYKLLPLFKNAFIETNPIPIKAAMNHFGMPAGPCRLPLCNLLPENEKILIETLQLFQAEGSLATIF